MFSSLCFLALSFVLRQTTLRTHFLLTVAPTRRGWRRSVFIRLIKLRPLRNRRGRQSLAGRRRRLTGISVMTVKNFLMLGKNLRRVSRLISGFTFSPLVLKVPLNSLKLWVLLTVMPLLLIG